MCILDALDEVVTASRPASSVRSINFFPSYAISMLTFTYYHSRGGSHVITEGDNEQLCALRSNDEVFKDRKDDGG